MPQGTSSPVATVPSTRGGPEGEDSDGVGDDPDVGRGAAVAGAGPDDRVSKAPELPPQPASSAQTRAVRNTATVSARGRNTLSSVASGAPQVSTRGRRFAGSPARSLNLLAS